MNVDSKVEVAVIGAGVVGLAIARSLALAGHEVLILEAEDAIGTQTSARGSHVIHSGIYYKKDSLKSKFCVRGKELLYKYCEEKGIPYKRLGKIILATSDQEIETLKDLQKRGKENNVNDLVWMTADEVHKKEPYVKSVAGLFSPSTGIVNAKELLKSIIKDAIKHDAKLQLASVVSGGEVTSEGIVLTVNGKNILCKKVINSAGLKAQEVAKSIKGVPAEKIPPAFYAKGHYFKLKTGSPFKHLIYPVPIPGGLGIHITMNMDGMTRFGPDVFWIDSIDYTFEKNREEVFYNAIRRYYPRLPANSLEPLHTGIRPKVVGKGEPEHDFIIQTSDEHGVPGLINLFGIESPGFTSSLAIAEEVEMVCL